MNDLISVIVPIYNVEAYLSRCVESLINQSYKNLEIILVDDGSPDNCPQISDDYAEKDVRIKVVHKENGGLSDARNAGLEIAKGEYISFIDSDDWIDLETYSLVMQKMFETNSQIGAFNIINVTNDEFNPNLSEEFEVMDSQKAIENTIDNINVRTVVWNKVYHKNIFEGLSFRKGRLNEDEFFTFYALARAEKIVYLYRQCYYYFQRPTSIMGVYDIRRLDMLDGVKERMDFIEKNYPQIFLKAKLSFCSSCIYQYQMLLKNKNKDIDGNGKAKVTKLRCSVKVKSDEVKNMRLKERLFHKMSNNSKGLDFICKIRNLFGIGF